MLTSEALAIDYETYLIAPGQQFPKAVCLSWASLDGSGSAGVERARAELAEVAYTRGVAGGNTAFESGVTIANYPHLTPLVFQAYAEDRVTDVLIRQQLIDLAEGRLRGYRKDESGKLRKIGYGLDDVASRLEPPIFLNKEDPWRLKYSELDGKEVSEYPKEAVDYSLGDATTTRTALLQQEAKRALLDDQFRQCRADFALKLTSARGLRTDPEAVPFFAATIDARLGELTETLSEPAAWVWSGAEWEPKGLLRPDGSRDTKAAQARMMAVCERDGKPVKRTPIVRKWNEKKKEFYNSGGSVCLDADTCEETQDPILELYGEYSQLLAVRSKDIDFLTRGTHEPIHCRYNCIMETGRASSSKPNIMNLRTLTGIREAFIPREGYVFAQADFGGLELATVAQVCLTLLGRSRLADFINTGKDPHIEIARRVLHMTYDEVYAAYKGPKGTALYNMAYRARQVGKVANFGFPGGLGAVTLVEYARALYDIRITVAEARNLKAIWLDSFPEFRRYFELIGEVAETGQGIGQLYVGRWRGKVTFTSACNTLFQGLGADLAKEAGWLIVTACFADPSSPLFGSFPVAFVHDEWILEVPEYKAAAAAEELSRLMCLAAGKYLTGVKMKAPPTLARRWSKECPELRDEAGVLQIWDRPYRELYEESQRLEAEKKALKLALRAA